MMVKGVGGTEESGVNPFLLCEYNGAHAIRRIHGIINCPRLGIATWHRCWSISQGARPTFHDHVATLHPVEPPGELFQPTLRSF